MDENNNQKRENAEEPQTGLPKSQPQSLLLSRLNADQGHAIHESQHTLPSSKDLPLLDINPEAERRMRINRILMRRRRHLRLYREGMPRVVTALAVAFLLVMLLITSSAGVAFAYYQAQLPYLNGIANHSLFQTTRIYDRNGHLLYELYDHSQDHGRRTYINYSDLLTNKNNTTPPLIAQATVAAEDHTFWNNDGIDLAGIVRAAYLNVQNQSVVGGGSTITQQLIKNQFFQTQPRTLQIKSEEALLAYGLTQQYPKWKIMEMYLNTVYYGDLNYGIEAAAQGYFNLQPKCTKDKCIPATAQLDLAQASFLAGLPQSPSYYDPITHVDSQTHKPQLALDRQKEVLNSMVQLGMITKQDAAQAEDEMSKYTFQPYGATHQIQAPHFVQYVVDQVLIPLLGAQNLLNGGYSIYTTLDLDLEQKVEQIAHDALYNGGPYSLSAIHNVNDAAVVVMNPFDGEILAMSGSANYNDNRPEVQGQFNAAIAERQPGSAFKPVVYATAFEMGWYPAMIIPDHKTIYPVQVSTNKYYSPQNYDGTFHTSFPMTVRNAIANSFNIPAIDAIEFTGIANVQNMAARLGLSEVASRPISTLGPSMALGSAEVSLLHLTGAYATFANQGVRVPPAAILEITDGQGHPVYKYDTTHPQGTQAIRPDVAFLITSILSDTKSRYHEFAPGNPLELDRPAAAKTGTTDSFRDNWAVGYTPYLAVGVWAGNSDNSFMHDVIGITGAGPIWHDVMEYAAQRYKFPADDFVKPNNVVLGTVSAYTGLLPHPGEPTVSDWFIEGTMPTIQGVYNPYIPPKQCNNNNGNNCQPPCIGFFCPPQGG